MNDIDIDITGILDQKFVAQQLPPEKPKPEPKPETEKSKEPKTIKIKKKNDISSLTFPPTAEEEKKGAIANAVKNARSLFAQGMLKPVTSNKELLQRINSYFEECELNCQLPTIEKMFLGLGYTRQAVENWYAGNVGTDRWVNKDTIEILERGKQVIAAIDSELVQLGKTKEISYVYRSKNFYGMQDKTTTEIQPVITQTYSPEELAERAKLIGNRK